VAAAPLELEARIPLGAVRGRIDHLAVDPLRKRIFIAELENNSLGIVDLNSARLLRRIGDLSEPQGVAYVRKPTPCLLPMEAMARCGRFAAKIWWRRRA